MHRGDGASASSVFTREYLLAHVLGGVCVHCIAVACLQMSFLDGSSSTVKKKLPTSAAVLREGLKTNLSAAEATSQLKVLCRKFAALAEKVKV